MKNKLILLLLLLGSLRGAAQKADTLKKYPNGNYLLKQSGNTELVSPAGAMLLSWMKENRNEWGPRERYVVVTSRGADTLQQGLVDMDSGRVVIPAEYDQLRKLSYAQEGLVTTKKKNRYGVVAINGKMLQPVYSAIYYHPDGRSLILVKDSSGHVINKALEITGTIPGMYAARLSTVRYRRDTSYMRILLKDREALLGSDNKWFGEKGWTLIEDFTGPHLIVSTRKGFGLYRWLQRKLVVPYSYRSVKTRAFYNEQVLMGKPGRWTLYDSSARMLMSVVADSLVPALDDWAGFFFLKQGKWGFLSVEGKVLIPPAWKSFSNPRFDYIDAVFPDGHTKSYYYEYKTVNNQRFITRVAKAV